jgi:hypothetical protein
MATRRPAAPAALSAAQAALTRISGYLPTATFEDGWKLLQRCQPQEAFGAWLRARGTLVVTAALVMLAASIAFAAGSVVFIAGARSLLVLPALLLAPFILAGSLFVQAYVFFSWLENRALAQALGRRPARPPVPWGLGAVFVLVPLLALASVSPASALTLIAAQAAVVLLIWRLDR